MTSSQNFKQLSPEWHKARENKLTGSVFGAAIGINPYMSRQKLFRQIKGIDPKFEGNEATEWGTLHEKDCVSQYEVDSGRIVIDTGFHIHSEHEWLGASPDGLVSDNGLVECKCPFSLNIYETIPLYYMAQIQGQLEIIDKDWCDFAVWTPYEFSVRRIERSKEYWEWMFPLLEEFWAYVNDDVEPKRKKKAVPPTIGE